MFGASGQKLRNYVIGGFLLAVVLAVTYLSVTVQNGLPFAPTTTVKAAMNDVGGLKVGDQVREHSTRVGKVSSITYDDGHAVVMMKLDGHVPVYSDAIAQVWDFSALATKFIELDYGSPASGPLGDKVIPMTRTVSSSDLYQLLNVLDEPTRKQLVAAIHGLGGGATGHGPDLHDLIGSAPDLLNDLSSVSDALSTDQADLPGLLRNTNDLAARFVNRRGQIAALIKQTDATFQGLSVDGAKPLSDTLQHLPPTLDHANTAFVALDKPLADTRSSFEQLRPGGQSLGEATPDVRGFLRDSRGPLDKLPDVSDDAKPALTDLTHTFHDLRPLAPKVSEAFGRLQEPLDAIAPYAPELGYLIVRLHSMVSQSTAPGVHYARASAVVGPDTLGLGSGVRDDLLLPHDPYPKPGAATFERNGHQTGGNR
jgi:phospholipid/cholesterol/gamma-HCH transport system substrate-binding protein